MSTIIKHKEFTNHKVYKTEVAGRPLTIDVGKVAELASASAMVTYGETTVLVAVTVSPPSSPRSSYLGEEQIRKNSAKVLIKAPFPSLRMFRERHFIFQVSCELSKKKLIFENLINNMYGTNTPNES